MPTFTKSKRGSDSIGRRQFLAGKLTLGPETYTAGGYLVTLATIKAQNARAIEGCMIIGGNALANSRKFHWDTGANKMMAAQTGSALSGVFTETGGGTDLSAVVLDVIFVLV